MNSDFLFKQFNFYKENSLKTRRFKHADILPLIEEMKENKIFEIKEIGRSVEKREIFTVKYGSGKTNVLLWSQMHGDEPTATMAMFDIFNFLSADDELNNFRNLIWENLTLHFIPLLNPDGAERVARTNALGIDLNRDAVRLVSPEAKILKYAAENIKPDFSFNLHDQDMRWSAGGGRNPSSISLLAPPFNDEREVNDIRKRAMKVIVRISNTLQNYIPNCVARYNDEFGPRSFGDNITKWGSSTILLESGRMSGDLEKEFIRKLNFIAFLSAFNSIATGEYENENLDDYSKIPLNGKLLYDIVFRNLTREIKGEKYKLDIAINVEEHRDEFSGKQYYEGKIEEIGDLSNIFGYEEFDCTGMSLHEAALFSGKNISKGNTNSEFIYGLVQNGFTHCLSKENSREKFTDIPINLVSNKKNFVNRINTEEYANFVIRKNEKIRFVVVNGFVQDFSKKNNSIKNGLIF